MARDYLFRRHLNNAAKAAWRWAFGQVPPTDVTVAEDMEIKRTSFPDSALFRYRSWMRLGSPAAYILESRRPLPAQQPVGRGRYDSHPRPKRRAAARAYFVGLTPSVPDVVGEEPSGKQLLPDRAPGRRRTQTPAYVITNLPPAIVEQIPVAPLFPVWIEGRRRAPNTAYHIRTTGNFVDEPAPEPPIFPVFPSTAPGRRRAANLAYWIPPFIYPPDRVQPACVELFDADFVTAEVYDVDAVTPDVSATDFTTPEVYDPDVC